MLTLSVHQRGDRAAVQIIDSPAQKHGAGNLKFIDRRREIELRGEPRFDGVTVRRRHIDQVLSERRANMTRDDIVQQSIVLRVQPRILAAWR